MSIIEDLLADLERNPTDPATNQLLQQIGDRIQAPKLKGTTGNGDSGGSTVRDADNQDYEENQTTDEEQVSYEEEENPEQTEEEDDPERPPGCQEGTIANLLREMREERRENKESMSQLIEAIASAHLTKAQLKSIPQVQPMHAKEDVTEYLEIFEETQKARGNHKDNWVHTLLPLLNKQCKSVVMSLPAASKLKYKQVKQEILSTASAHTKQAAKVFWEHSKKAGTTWREEASTLLKQIKKFTPGPTAELVRTQVATEKLIQMLPGRAQAFVREREPSSPTKAADLASSYFASHNMDELQWESYKDLSKKQANFKDKPNKFHTSTTQKARLSTLAPSHPYQIP